jgi:catechol 2,3-dioxygenase-like lactoylglutathione lyase family enzyme
MHVLETCLYATDLKSAKGFYAQLLGLELVQEEPGRHVFFRCGDGMVLLFNPRATCKPSPQGIEVPTHGATGPGHLAFAATPEELDQWRARLLDHGVSVEREIEWPNGARSLYFRDPAGNSLEFATPRLWQGTGDE